MRFVCVLGTLDDGELISASINHLRRIGVELIIVVDKGSADGTLEVIAREETRGDVWLFHVARDVFPDPFSSDRYVTLARSSGADWAVSLDADEFLLPVTGSLHDVPEFADNDIVTIERFDAALPREGIAWTPDSLAPAQYGDVLLQVVSDAPDEWPRVMARPQAISRLLTGHHEAVPDPSGTWASRIADNVLVAHLPFSSLSRFERKVANIARSVAMNPGFFSPGMATQWMDWHRVAQEGRTAEEFEAQLLSPERLTQLRASGEVRSAAELLEHRRTWRIGSAS